MSQEYNVVSDGNQAETRQGVVRWLVREVLGVVFVALTLFIPAGTVAWPMGWALVALYGLWVAANALLLIPTSPGLLAERASRKPSAKSWDTALLSIYGLLTLAKYIVAGLDLRYGWTGSMALAVHVVGLVVAALGYAMVTWSMTANAFFSTVNRIQDDRGHGVASSGPYRFVRHPGYVGSILFEVATPLLLGSLWALALGIVAALLLIVRTALEDRMLHQELPGYGDYARQVRWRLLPGVW